MSMIGKSMIQLLLKRPVAFHPVFAEISGSITAGLFLAQAFYWADRGGVDGWFWKTQAEWQKETYLTRYEQETARKKLRDLGVLEEERRGNPCKLYFRVNMDVMMNLLTTQQTSMRESRNQGCVIAADKSAGNTHTLHTESSPENPDRDLVQSATGAFNPVSCWCDFYKSKTGQGATILPRTAKNITDVFRRMGQERFELALDGYFRSNGRWESEHNWDWATFMNSPDRYLASNTFLVDDDIIFDEE